MTRAGTYEVALEDGKYFLKLSGHLSYSACGPLSDLISVIRDDKSCQGVMLDLREALMIDSTHLGLVARLAIESKEKRSQQLTILSNEHIVTQALKQTGLQLLAVILDAPTGGVPPSESVKSLPDSERDVVEVMLEAHQTLLGVSDENRATFQDVVEMLENSMKEKTNA